MRSLNNGGLFSDLALLLAVSFPVWLVLFASEFVLGEFDHVTGQYIAYPWVYTYIIHGLFWFLAMLAILKGQLFVPVSMLRCSVGALFAGFLLALSVDVLVRFLLVGYQILVPPLPDISRVLLEIDRSATLLFFANIITSNIGSVLTIPVYLFLGTWVGAFLMKGNRSPKMMIRRGAAASSYFLPRYVLIVGGLYLISVGSIWMVNFIPFPREMYVDPIYSFEVAGRNYHVINTGSTLVATFLLELKTMMLGVLLARAYFVGEARLAESNGRDAQLPDAGRA
ncbi:hypothetical protein [Thalassospira lucentensis]|uniref:hypothetical protein n=1 Tax=Thalassospira lucentensis TaxID=168935 RepID=UPI0003B4D056|nr:hypothetical protein [Thalassospira lucentensis]RCK27727.1 hypothetical protein TH1_10625 [Thalassospira lucentensis MCCC 1A00383 = DSM 14000]